MVPPEDFEVPPVTKPTVAHRKLVPQALALLTDEEPCALFYDLDQFRATLGSIRAAFPASATHAIAMKANPLSACLIIARDMGMGCEVASPAELEHALRLGFVAEQIVLDSPAKTRRDLRRALAAGVRLNADNFEELERIDAILAQIYGGGGKRGMGSCTSASIGVRVNPQLGEGVIATTATAAPTSKFGVALQEARPQLLAAYHRYAWLSCVHVHVGSQGCPLGLLVKGARAVLLLAKEINTHVGSRQVRVLDLGGGLPVDYDSDAPDADVPERLTMVHYAAALREAVPEAFDTARWTLLTEFGRYVHAKCGLMLSTVEYVKSAGGRRLATVHCGADLFLRTCYQPEAWPHRVSAWGADGKFLDPSRAECDTWDVVGPLCFRGDIIAEARRLPAALAGGCAIAVHDAGACE